jgi:UDP-GlcNAc:undecaprenyl-phosphate GlcNAc-1-phosphate transferase
LSMSTAAVSALFVSAAITLLTTPLVRELARGIGLVDKPAGYKVQPVPIPYLGGVAIAAGTLAGMLVVGGPWPPLGALALIAVGLCVVGLVDDHRLLAPTTRLGLEAVAAAATVALGLRLTATGIAVVDGALTIVWVVGVINATNLLDNMDGLGAGVAASIATSSLLLMLDRDGAAVIGLAAGLVGACLGFLAYNKRPASVYMGDAGSLFLGYLLAVITLASTQSLPSAGTRLVTPLMLAAIPVADTTTVVLARLRRGISPMQAGRDHLSHRLVQRGVQPGSAVALLVSASLLMGLLATFAGRGTISLPAAAVAAAAVLGPVLRAALQARVYDAAALPN